MFPRVSTTETMDVCPLLCSTQFTLMHSCHGRESPSPLSQPALIGAAMHCSPYAFPTALIAPTTAQSPSDKFPCHKAAL
jgi:hypothetical protein